MRRVALESDLLHLVRAVDLCLWEKKRQQRTSMEVRNVSLDTLCHELFAVNQNECKAFRHFLLIFLALE